jgi:hypothetical protein
MTAQETATLRRSGSKVQRGQWIETFGSVYIKHEVIFNTGVSPHKELIIVSLRQRETNESR